MALWRIIVKGQQIQGVGFRESAVSAFNKAGMKGYARNMRETGKVELLLLSDIREYPWDKAKIQKEFRLPKLPHEDEEILKVVVAGAIKKVSELIPAARDAKIEHVKSFSDDYLEEQIQKQEAFEAKREDDLHEMVWALQGAGNLFTTATKQINELLKYKKDERFIRLTSLKCELAQAQNKLQNANKIELACLKDFIRNPLINIDPGTLQQFMEFYDEFIEFMESTEEEKKRNLKVMSEKISGMMKKVEEVEDKHKAAG